MEFMDLLKEWLDLRDLYAGVGGDGSWDVDVSRDFARMAWLETEINARMRGELPR